MSRRPRITIGMAMYNGERYLAESIESILAQTYTNWEIIISDNASEDATEQLCRDYARKDQRIRYYRNHKNIGAGPNHVRVCDMARTEFFKWHSCDDVCAPTFLQKCIDILDADKAVVLCHPLTKLIDSESRVTGEYKRRQATHSKNAPERFRQMVWYDHMCYQIYGVIRTESIRKCGGMGCYVHGDGVLLSRLALLGRFHEIPEFLFLNRRHDRQSAATVAARLKGRRRRLFNCSGQQPPPDWWDPRMRGAITFPYFRILYEYAASLRMLPLSLRDRLLCYAYLFPWSCKVAPRMANDLLMALDDLADPLLNRKIAEERW